MFATVDQIVSGSINTSDSVLSLPECSSLVPSVVSLSKIFHLFKVSNQGSGDLVVSKTCNRVVDHTGEHPITIPAGETYVLRLSILDENAPEVLLSQEIPARHVLGSI